MGFEKFGRLRRRAAVRLSFAHINSRISPARSNFAKNAARSLKKNSRGSAPESSPCKAASFIRPQFFRKQFPFRRETAVSRATSNGNLPPAAFFGIVPRDTAARHPRPRATRRRHSTRKLRRSGAAAFRIAAQIKATKGGENLSRNSSHFALMPPAAGLPRPRVFARAK